MSHWHELYHQDQLNKKQILGYNNNDKNIIIILDMYTDKFTAVKFLSSYHLTQKHRLISHNIKTTDRFRE